MKDIDKITSNYYEKYVGCWAKRFYSPFKENNIVKIEGFELRKGVAFFKMVSGDESWEWDVEDCVIITNEQPLITDDRIANIAHSEYKGWNPYQEL